MAQKKTKLQYNHALPDLIQATCIGLKDKEGKTLPDNSIHALVTDPPYGINYQNNHWDKIQNGKLEVPDRQTRHNA